MSFYDPKALGLLRNRELITQEQIDLLLSWMRRLARFWDATSAVGAAP